MRKIEDDVLDNGDGTVDNGDPVASVPTKKKSNSKNAAIVFAVFVIGLVVAKALGFL